MHPLGRQGIDAARQMGSPLLAREAFLAMCASAAVGRVHNPVSPAPPLDEKVSSDIEVQTRYFEMRLNGESHRLAEMLATRTFPGTKTDADFFKGKVNGSQFEDSPQVGDHYRAVSESLGQSTTGKVYLAQLADFPGDPEAWVSGRGDIERIAERKGLKISGIVDCDYSRDVAPTPDVRVADDLIEPEVLDILDSNPHLRPEDVREHVLAARSGEIDNHPELEVTEPNSDYIDFS